LGQNTHEERVFEFLDILLYPDNHFLNIQRYLLKP
jgi:hypothetical protein